MRFDDFVEALYTAGWLSTGDAQHTRIKELWKTLYPVVAELEDEVQELEADLHEYVANQPPL